MSGGGLGPQKNFETMPLQSLENVGNADFTIFKPWK